MKIFGGTLGWSNKYKDQEILTNGGTPGTNSLYPGWGSTDL